MFIIGDSTEFKGDPGEVAEQFQIERGDVQLTGLGILYIRVDLVKKPIILLLYNYPGNNTKNKESDPRSNQEDLQDTFND